MIDLRTLLRRAGLGLAVLLVFFALLAMGLRVKARRAFEEARAADQKGDLATAIDDLTRLLQETASVYGENATITRGVSEQLGKAHYYATWVLKTSGASEEDWRPFSERARQLFRYLAELEEKAIEMAGERYQ